MNESPESQDHDLIPDSRLYSLLNAGIDIATFKQIRYSFVAPGLTVDEHFSDLERAGVLRIEGGKLFGAKKILCPLLACPA